MKLTFKDLFIAESATLLFVLCLASDGPNKQKVSKIEHAEKDTILQKLSLLQLLSLVLIRSWNLSKGIFISHFSCPSNGQQLLSFIKKNYVNKGFPAM